jgi:hypothetical protein
MSDADKPDDLTIVTVKGMSVEAWKRGRKAAEKRDEMMGPWLSRAINLLADQQTGWTAGPGAAAAAGLHHGRAAVDAAGGPGSDGPAGAG